MLCTSLNAEAHQYSTSLVRSLAKSYKLALAAFLALSLFTGISSCSQGFIESLQDTAQKAQQSVQQMQSFQATLANKYQEGEIGVEINYTSTEEGWIKTVNIQLINTSFNKSTSSDRQKVARDVAELAKNYLALDKPEDSVLVSFVDFHNYYAVVRVSQVIDSYTLHPSEFVPIPPPSSSTTRSI